MRKASFSRKCFNIFNYTLMIVVCLTCVLPFVHLLALSFSSSTAVDAGKVAFWPVDFTTKSYEFALESGKFFKAFLVSVKRVILGVGLNMIMMVLTAYPLSKGRKVVGRNIYMVYFVITMLIGGGMIPTYLVVSKVGLLDSIWALVLPSAVPVYNTIILMNFMREMPEEIEEAALIDGASVFQCLIKVTLPLLKPALATVCLFSTVGHWNAWFDGIIYMNNPNNYPLQSYMRTLLTSFEDIMRSVGNDFIELQKIMNIRTGRAAQLFMGALPIMLVYPFLQKYFTKGLVLGSVKG